MKLKAMEKEFALELGATEGAMHVISMALRPHGLVRSTGRGTGAADMGADDAAAFLLGCLGPHLGWNPTNAADAVMTLGTAKLSDWGTVTPNGLTHGWGKRDKKLLPLFMQDIEFDDWTLALALKRAFELRAVEYLKILEAPGIRRFDLVFSGPADALPFVAFNVLMKDERRSSYSAVHAIEGLLFKKIGAALLPT